MSDNRTSSVGHESAAASARTLNQEVLLRSLIGQDLNVFSVFKCGALILILKIVLKVRGFAWVIGWLRHQMESVPLITGVNPASVMATESAVAMAGALYPGRALCLEQSLVLYYLLRKQGVAVRYCQGVQPHPFLAHAWVEYGGAPINDVAEHTTYFARLPALLP